MAACHVALQVVDPSRQYHPQDGGTSDPDLGVGSLDPWEHRADRLKRIGVDAGLRRRRPRTHDVALTGTSSTYRTRMILPLAFL